MRVLVCGLVEANLPSFNAGTLETLQRLNQFTHNKLGDEVKVAVELRNGCDIFVPVSQVALPDED